MGQKWGTQPETALDCKSPTCARGTIIGNVKLSRVTADAVDRARKVLLNTPCKRADVGPEYQRSPAVVKRYYAALQHCMGKACDWGRIERNLTGS